MTIHYWNQTTWDTSPAPALGHLQHFFFQKLGKLLSEQFCSTFVNGFITMRSQEATPSLAKPKCLTTLDQAHYIREEILVQLMLVPKFLLTAVGPGLDMRNHLHGPRYNRVQTAASGWLRVLVLWKGILIFWICRTKAGIWEWLQSTTLIKNITLKNTNSDEAGFITPVTWLD